MPYIVACTLRKPQTMEQNKIYFDNASTTIVKPEVLETYVKAKTQFFANPSSIHLLGQEADRLLQKAREQILNTLGVKDDELIFTSGATEANNLAIKGYAFRYQNRGKHIIVSNVEHPSVLETVKQLENHFGYEVTYLPVNKQGVVEVKTLKAAIRKDTILVSIMAVNNEIGTVNPIGEIADLLKGYPLIAFHVDATQGIGKIKLPLDKVDMFSFSGHKIHGLNSSGCLIKKKKIELLSLLNGGGQENGLRSGTNDLALAVSLAKAVRLEYENLDRNYAKVLQIAEKLKNFVKNHDDLFELNSGDNPYIVNFSLKNKKASVVVEALSSNGIMVSSVSACKAKEEAMSYVVKALGKNDTLAHNTIRVSFCEDNTLEEVDVFIKKLMDIVEAIK